MADPTDGKSQLQSQSRELKRSAKAVEQSSAQLAEGADRRTVLAGDRTLLAAERTYAAWVRTALAALAAGVGSAALVRGVLPMMVGKVVGTVLILFAGFCLTPIQPRPDIKPLPRALLVPMNFLLLLVAVAAMVGIWSA